MGIFLFRSMTCPENPYGCQVLFSGHRGPGQDCWGGHRGADRVFYRDRPAGVLRECSSGLLRTFRTSGDLQRRLHWECRSAWSRPTGLGRRLCPPEHGHANGRPCLRIKIQMRSARTTLYRGGHPRAPSADPFGPFVSAAPARVEARNLVCVHLCQPFNST
jgi:hypothetical protein